MSGKGGGRGAEILLVWLQTFYAPPCRTPTILRDQKFNPPPLPESSGVSGLKNKLYQNTLRKKMILDTLGENMTRKNPTPLPSA